MKQLFLLDPSITYLNHGSFGACPQPIFDDYIKWEREYEREPVQFVTVTGPRYLEESRKALGDYIGCHHDDLVYTPNPTYAINIIAKSFELKAGDEILTTDLEYGAMDRTWNYYCRKAGAFYRRQAISLPVLSKESFIEEFSKGFNERTRAIFISQITSSTALRFPVAEICSMARERGLITIVDGAHVPGHIPLDLRQLPIDIYTGACHKWMLTPKGCSFLFVKKELQERFDPLVVSWGFENASPSHSPFIDYHQMQGTRDFSGFLTVPKAIEFLNENNWPEVAASCRQLVADQYRSFCELLDSEPLCPVTDEFLGQMASIPIRTSRPQQLKDLLFERYKIEIPVMVHERKIFLRYSINAYNDRADLDRLREAIAEIKKEGVLLE